MLKLIVAVLFTIPLMAGGLNKAPLNPKFIQWQQIQQIEKLTSTTAAVGANDDIKTTGWRPSPLPEEVHVSQTGGSIERVGTPVYPTRFDLSDPNLDLDRSDTMLTPVKDQSSCGVCWAFAAYGAYEGQVNIDNYGLFDFSEQNLRYLTGTGWTNSDPCSGGNLSMVTAYLARGSGPVSEADDPYNLAAGNSYNPNATPIRYVENVKELPLRDINNKTDIDYIKDVIYKQQKPLYVSLQVGYGTAGETGESVWDAATNSFYCDNGGVSVCTSNHAVVIVGWDDNYVAQGQTGAFILRNSWSSSWGQNGYFYVPYNDDSIALSGTIGYFEDKDTYSKVKVYQHDELPLVYGYGVGASSPIWGANKFTVEKRGVVKAVGLYAIYSQTSYEIKLFKTMSGTTFLDQAGTTQTSVSTLPRGWHTIDLDTPVLVEEGETLIAQVRFLTPSGSYPLVVEGDLTFDSVVYTDAVSAPGESYYSTNGVNFYDLYTFSTNDENVAIKAIVVETAVKTDFNADGNADILFKKDNGDIIVQLMNGDGKLGQLYVMDDRGWNTEAIADFDSNGYNDILFKDDTGALRIQFFNAGGKVNKLRLMNDRGWVVEGTGDFNNDGNSDILFRKADGTLSVVYIDVSGKIGQQFISLDRGREVGAVADFDGNGFADILFKQGDGSRVIWYMGTGGKLSNLLITGTGLSSWSVKGTGDFNHDGNEDILFQKPDGTNLVWTMSGAGKLGKIDITKTWDALAVGDYNGDGDADVLFKRPNGSLSVLLMSGSGEIGSIFVMNDLGWNVVP